MTKMLDRLLSWIFPRRCNICGEVISLDDTLCDDCKCNSRIGESPCAKCGKDKYSCSCKMSIRTPSYKRVVAPFYYDENLVKAVHRFKFGDYPELSKGMAREMVDTIKREYKHINFDAVTYIPMSEERQKARGYNQSYLLAKEIANILGFPLEDTFYRAYNSTPQRNKTAIRRDADIFAAFDINEDVDPKGKTYLVVDDVKTTGSTLSECAAVLDAYGATETYAVAFAIR